MSCGFVHATKAMNTGIGGKPDIGNKLTRIRHKFISMWEPLGDGRIEVTMSNGHKIYVLCEEDEFQKKMDDAF